MLLFFIVVLFRVWFIYIWGSLDVVIMVEGIFELVNFFWLVIEFYFLNFVVYYFEIVNEIWDLREEIGYGGFGVVWKEECWVYFSGEKY